MTIIKINKDGKLVLKNKPDELAIPLAPEDTDQPPARIFHIEVSHTRRSRALVNVFILIIALMVLTVGVIGGVYLYKYMSQKHKMAKITVQYESPESVPSPVASNMQTNYGEPGVAPHGMFFMMEEEVDIEIDQEIEKIQVPKFDECRSSVVIHDFHKNVTVIVDNEDRECFIMDLDKNMTPPRDLDQLISRYYSGYYMPKVHVVRNDYVVVQPPLWDLQFAGPIISAECLRYNTYRLEKRMIPREIIEIRFTCKTYGYTDMKTLIKDSIFK